MTLVSCGLHCHTVTAILWHLVPTDPMLTDCQDHDRLLARSMTHADHRITVYCERHAHLWQTWKRKDIILLYKVLYNLFQNTLFKSIQVQSHDPPLQHLSNCPTHDPQEPSPAIFAAFLRSLGPQLERCSASPATQRGRGFIRGHAWPAHQKRVQYKSPPSHHQPLVRGTPSDLVTAAAGGARR